MAWFKLIYHQIVYWIVGTSPEAHHANLASAWYELNRYQNCIVHCQKFLGYEDSEQIKAMMAYCHGSLGQWEQAVDAYRSISKIWSVPSFALGLAEAELRCGNIDEARKTVATVEVSDPNPKYDVAMSLDYIKKELADVTVSERPLLADSSPRGSDTLNDW